MLSAVPTQPLHFVQPAHAPRPQPLEAPVPPLRLMFWETTKACNLECKHCRAVPQKGLGRLDLSTEEAFAFMDGVAEIAKPVFILSGGEPLYRPDIFDLAKYGKGVGFRMALATNGTLVDEEIARRVQLPGHAARVREVRVQQARPPQPARAGRAAPGALTGRRVDR